MCRGEATLLIAPRSDGGGECIDGVQSDASLHRWRLAVRSAAPRRLLLQMSGDTGKWVWSFSRIGPLRMRTLELLDANGERLLGFSANLAEAERLDAQY